MGRYGMFAGVLLAAMLAFAGCGGEGETPAQTRTGQQVPIFREFKGQQGPFENRGFFVVQRQDTWNALWEGTTAPEVDFSRQSVLVALMGQQPTAGYEIRIDDVRATGQQINVYVAETRPGAGESVAQVVTFPYAMAVVPKLTQSANFIVEGATTPPVTIQEQFTGQQSKVTNPQTFVVRDQAAWRQFWTNNIDANATAPAVDFAQNMAVAVFIGQKPTGGYSVMITSVDRVDDRLTVSYRIRSPKPDAVVTQALTSPYAVATIPASPLPVVFRNVTPPAGG